MTMRTLIVVIAVIGVTAAIPQKKRLSSERSDECRLAQEREQCLRIFIEAFDAPRGYYSDMKRFFQRYCRKIPDFVPCLEENKADYEAMAQCPGDEMFISGIVSRFDHLLTWREMFNITIDLLDTVNNIVCTRTEEIIKLVRCIKTYDDEKFEPLLLRCDREYLNALVRKMYLNKEKVAASEICSSTYGFTTCVKGGLIDMCGTEFNDLLDTVYYDVVEDVIGDGFGCKESSSSDRLLDFARAVRNLYRK